MKVLILGGTGFVGSHLLNQLVAQGHQARVISRNPTVASDARVAPGCQFRAVDVFDTEQLAEQLKDCQAIINLVGILNESGRSGRGFERAHVETVAAAIEACQQAGVSRFLQMSSLNAGQGNSHYLRTRGRAEQLLADSDLDWTIFQPSVIFGPGDAFINRFASMLRLVPLGLPLACPGARLQPVFVGDVVRAVVHCLGDTVSIGQRYELGGPRIYTLAELVRFVRDSLGLRRLIVGLPGPLSYLQALIMEFVPGKPFSLDNYRSLQVDNVAASDGLASLGIKACSLEAVVPDYLGSATRSGRYQRSRRRAGR